jgi:3-hydroxyacyl-CoA dehydrogenase
MPRNQPNAGPAHATLSEKLMTTPDLSAGPRDATAYVEYATREVWNVADLPPEKAATRVDTAGIVGAGTMGGGIAMNFLNAGIPVTLVETQVSALERGIATIRSNYERSARKGKLTTQEIDARMSLLTGSLTLEDLSSCDLIIEAVYEELALKKQVFSRLDAIARSAAILATNTSGLDIDAIACVTRRPGSVIGLHFFSPANVMRLIEVVRADKTEPSVIASCMQVARRLGKTAVLVGVCPGFVGNRMLYPRQVQAEQLVLEGAMPWDIDRALCEFGFPMGPFQMGDLAGLDIGWSRETSKGETLREMLCELDRRGQKTRSGFYDYDENRVASPSPVTEKAVLALSAKRGIARRAVSASEILQRCIYPMINEGAKILEEGTALRASDIDVVWLYGYGWPAHRGGPMFYADTIGLDAVVTKLRELESTLGARFTPAPLLRRLAESGGRFCPS